MHPKNTTGSPPAQHQMATTAEDFHPIVVLGVKQHVFQVNAGLPAEEAINAAYALLDASEYLCSDAIHNEASHSHIVAVRFLVQGAKALVGACMGAVEEANNLGGAQ